MGLALIFRHPANKANVRRRTMCAPMGEICVYCPLCTIKQSVGNGLDRSGDIFAYAVTRFTAGLIIRCGNDNTANHFANVQ